MPLLPSTCNKIIAKKFNLQWFNIFKDKSIYWMLKFAALINDCGWDGCQARHGIWPCMVEAITFK